VSPNEKMKSVSAETTFNEDQRDPEMLDAQLWRLTEKVSDRLKAKGIAGRTATLKLKTARFRVVTRRRSVSTPIQLADSLYRQVSPLLRAALEDTALARDAFRLIGVGVSDLSAAEDAAEAGADLFDSAAPYRAKAERAVDSLRERFGRHVIGKGRGLK
jgi:DNA polymerase-4